jgi:hypothetical protein
MEVVEPYRGVVRVQMVFSIMTLPVRFQGCRVQGQRSRFRVRGSGCRVQASGFRIQHFGVWNLGFQGSGI